MGMQRVVAAASVSSIGGGGAWGGGGGRGGEGTVGALRYVSWCSVLTAVTFVVAAAAAAVTSVVGAAACGRRTHARTGGRGRTAATWWRAWARAGGKYTDDASMRARSRGWAAQRARV
jgi:hypothetical protein